LEKVTAEYIAYNEEKIERFKKSLVSLTEALKKLTTDETYKNQIVQDIIEAHQKNTGIIEEITESEKATLVKLQKHARKCRIEDLETDIKGYQNNITIAKGGLTMENSVNLHLKMY
jgi:hypothetical protein